MYMFAIENENFAGVYNMVSPNPVTNKQLVQAIARQLHKPMWAPNVPAFVLKLLMGEMSTIVLGSTKVSAQKIEDAGFKFKYPELISALKQIYG
jgi:NAD dependent epimerase/dehydratase family enzyme